MLVNGHQFQTETLPDGEMVMPAIYIYLVLAALWFGIGWVFRGFFGR